MNSITIVRNSGIVAAALMLAVFVAAAPAAKAADLTDFGGGSYADYGSYSTPTDYGSSYADYGSYTTPSSYYGGYGTSVGGYYGGYGFGGMGGYGGYGFGGAGGFGGSSSTYAPTTVSTYAPTNTNTCTAPNSCNSTVDDHSIFNAPTTVTVTNPAPAQTQTQVVYQQVPVYQQPSYPVYNNPCTSCQAPVVYPTPVRQPYVSLTQVPYTGLDLGPVGTVMYWGFLVLWCLVAAYLVAVKRVQTKVVSGLNRFLFGSAVTVGTHAKVVHPAAHSAHAVKAHASAATEDAIDPFIASQISRSK